MLAQLGVKGLMTIMSRNKRWWSASLGGITRQPCPLTYYHGLLSRAWCSNGAVSFGPCKSWSVLAAVLARCALICPVQEG